MRCSPGSRLMVYWSLNSVTLRNLAAGWWSRDPSTLADAFSTGARLHEYAIIVVLTCVSKQSLDLSTGLMPDAAMLGAACAKNWCCNTLVSRAAGRLSYLVSAHMRASINMHLASIAPLPDELCQAVDHSISNLTATHISASMSTDKQVEAQQLALHT